MHLTFTVRFKERLSGVKHEYKNVRSIRRNETLLRLHREGEPTLRFTLSAIKGVRIVWRRSNMKYT